MYHLKVLYGNHWIWLLNKPGQIFNTKQVNRYKSLTELAGVKLAIIPA